MISGSKSIVIEPVGEDGYCFTFTLPAGKMFVSKIFDTVESASFAANEMRSGHSDKFSIIKKIAPTNDTYFIMCADDGNPVGQSDLFELVTYMELAIEHLRKHLPLARVLLPSNPDK